MMMSTVTMKSILEKASSVRLRSGRDMTGFWREMNQPCACVGLRLPGSNRAFAGRRRS